MKNSVGWFEIATTDIERAKAFYAKVFETDFQDVNMGESQLAIFNIAEDSKGITGALVLDKDNTPSTDGTLVYFNSEDVAIEAGRIEQYGGKLLFPKTAIGEFGFIAQFIDTEGNRIGLHSNK